MYKVITKDDFLTFKNLPFEVVEIAKRTIYLLDNVYNTNRYVTNNEGGYVIILTEYDSTNVLENLGLNISKLNDNYVEILRTKQNGNWIYTVFNIYTDFCVTVLAPHDVWYYTS